MKARLFGGAPFTAGLTIGLLPVATGALVLTDNWLRHTNL